MRSSMGVGARFFSTNAIGLAPSLFWLASDDEKEAALAATRNDFPGLDEQVVQGRTARFWLKEVRPFQLHRAGGHRWHAAHEFYAGMVEPLEHLADRVLRFVGMAVLVGKPRPALRLITRPPAQDWVDPLRMVTGETEHVTAHIRHQPTVTIVQADHDVPTRLQEWQ